MGSSRFTQSMYLLSLAESRSSGEASGAAFAAASAGGEIAGCLQAARPAETTATRPIAAKGNIDDNERLAMATSSVWGRAFATRGPPTKTRRFAHLRGGGAAGVEFLR